MTINRAQLNTGVPRVLLPWWVPRWAWGAWNRHHWHGAAGQVVAQTSRFVLLAEVCAVAAKRKDVWGLEGPREHVAVTPAILLGEVQVAEGRTRQAWRGTSLAGICFAPCERALLEHDLNHVLLGNSASRHGIGR